jgi:hypothetical protein
VGGPQSRFGGGGEEEINPILSDSQPVIIYPHLITIWGNSENMGMLRNFYICIRNYNLLAHKKMFVFALNFTLFIYMRFSQVISELVQYGFE